MTKICCSSRGCGSREQREKLSWMKGFCLGIISPTGKCRSFSEDADGTVSGEGVIAFLLKPLEKALADGDQVHAVIKGSGVNQDGSRSNGLTAPSPVAQQEVIQRAWQRAGVDPTTISYIEAHGSATPLGDPIEITGFIKAFADFTDEKKFCPNLKKMLRNLPKVL